MSNLYVCANSDSPTPFDDNQTGKCACGQSIMWRPHAPLDIKKVCIDCAIMYSREDEKKGEKPHIAATPSTWSEIQKFFGGKK